MSSAAGLLAALPLAVVVCACPRAQERIAPPPPLPPAPSSVVVADALPGPCVDPVRDARRRLGSDADAAGVRVDALDLDDDGTPDPIVTHESFCGTGGCDWQLYVARGACAHFVGSMFTVWPLPQSRAHHGLVDLLAVVRNGCAGAARTEQETSFDGTRYVVVRQRSCRCPEPSDHPGEVDPDASCGEWQEPPVAGAP